MLVMHHIFSQQIPPLHLVCVSLSPPPILALSLLLHRHPYSYVTLALALSNTINSPCFSKYPVLLNGTRQNALEQTRLSGVIEVISSVLLSLPSSSE